MLLQLALARWLFRAVRTHEMRLLCAAVVNRGQLELACLLLPARWRGSGCRWPHDIGRAAAMVSSLTDFQAGWDAVRSLQGSGTLSTQLHACTTL